MFNSSKESQLRLIETRVVFESVTRGENIDAVVRLIETRVVFEFGMYMKYL